MALRPHDRRASATVRCACSCRPMGFHLPPCTPTHCRSSSNGDRYICVVADADTCPESVEFKCADRLHGATVCHRTVPQLRAEGSLPPSIGAIDDARRPAPQHLFVDRRMQLDVSDAAPGSCGHMAHDVRDVRRGAEGSSSSSSSSNSHSNSNSSNTAGTWAHPECHGQGGRRGGASWPRGCRDTPHGVAAGMGRPHSCAGRGDFFLALDYLRCHACGVPRALAEEGTLFWQRY